MFKEAVLAGKEAFDEVGRLSAARLLYQQQITQAENAIKAHKKDVEALAAKLAIAEQNLVAAETRICSVVKNLA